MKILSGVLLFFSLAGGSAQAACPEVTGSAGTTQGGASCTKHTQTCQKVGGGTLTIVTCTADMSFWGKSSSESVPCSACNCATKAKSGAKGSQ